MKTCPHWNPLASKCGGCFDRNLNFSRLSQIKEKAVLKTFEQNFDYQPDQASLIIPENTEIREKLDFLIEGNSIGLKSQTPPYSVIDITSCDVIEKTLFETFLSLRPYLKNLVERGSFRLRLGLDKTPYLWMDVSHADTQRLFKQKKTLMPLFELCEIEWGQRKKPLILDSSGEFKLLKKYSTLPSLFQTSVLNEPFNLKMHVSDFSQPNTQLNFQIIEHITQILKQKPKPILAEFGSGIGNFTFAMAHYCQHIVCFEWDQFACEAWNENIEEFQKKYSHIPCQIQLVHRDARAQFSIESFSPKFLFVNPSRSGLGDFLKSISMKDVEFILYLSCYHETLIKDMLPLKDQFVCEKIICIDQFPYSRHIETLSFWIRR